MKTIGSSIKQNIVVAAALVMFGLVTGYPELIQKTSSANQDARQQIGVSMDQPVAGESLLKGGRTLKGLNEDLKLLLYDKNGQFREKAIFNSGLLVSGGFLLSDGLLLSDGILMGD